MGILWRSHEEVGIIFNTIRTVIPIFSTKFPPLQVKTICTHCTNIGNSISITWGGRGGVDIGIALIKHIKLSDRRCE